MFKKVCLFVIACGIGVTISGCGAQLAIGALEAAGHLGAFNSSGVSSNPLLGVETERYNIGKYEVGMSGGFYKNDSGIIFMAYDQGKRTQFLFYDKNNPDDMKMMEDFNRMNETEKKLFIKTRFLKVAKLDLGPIEPEPPKETTVSTPSSLPTNIPTPGFAPTPNTPR